MNLLRKGEKLRKRRQTIKNDFSSRSHTIFQIQLEPEKARKNGTLKRSCLYFCDLAGSERANKSLLKNLPNGKGVNIQFSELTSINQSLATLGNVINSLAKRASYVQYRDSKLTRILQDSLGGTTKTYFIVTLSPSASSYEENVNSLQFAIRAKSVSANIRVNEYTLPQDEDLIKKLRFEILTLKEILALRKKRGTLLEIEEQLVQLKYENQALKSLDPHLEIEDLIKENRRLKLEIQHLKGNELGIVSNLDKEKEELSNNKMFSKKEIKTVKAELIESKTQIQRNNEYSKMSNENEAVLLDLNLVNPSLVLEKNTYSLASGQYPMNSLSTKAKDITSISSKLASTEQEKNTNSTRFIHAGSSSIKQKVDYESKELKRAGDRIKYLEKLERESISRFKDFSTFLAEKNQIKQNQSDLKSFHTSKKF